MKLRALWLLALLGCSDRISGALPSGNDAGVLDLGPIVPGPDVGFPDAGACAVAGDLDTFIEREMSQNRIPGLAAGIVSENGLLWARGYGFASIVAQRGPTPATIFALMSISKVVTAVGVMQLAEARRLDLDADVNGYLRPFAIRHPDFPNRPITTRQLLAHASGLAGDDYGVLQLNIAGSDAEVQPLGDMLAALLVPGGARYSSGSNYARVEPGSAFAYSSIGISLAAFVAEQIAGQGFDRFTATSIFERLAMNDSSWRLAPYANRSGELAVMYHYDEATQRFNEVAPFTFADYPAGSIRASVNDLALFLAAMIGDGSYLGRRILAPATATAMRELQFPNASSTQALGWTRSDGARRLIGHGGDDVGASTNMAYDLDTKRGIILLMNVTRRPNTDRIVDRLFEESDRCR